MTGGALNPDFTGVISFQDRQEELQATLIVHDDGRKEWDWMRHEGQGSGDLKTAIEQAAEVDPQAERWTYQTLTIRQSQSH
jgi:hypothetical protein